MEANTTSHRSAIEYFKYAYSTALLAVSVVLVMACIVKGQSSAAELGIPPAVAAACFWLLVAWLAIMEGGQGCLVGLKPIPSSRYRETHPLTHASCKLAHEGDNLERFIVGRQFLVVLVIFLINRMGEATEGADPLHLPSMLNAIFLQNGVAMMITTIDIGQLPAQVNAAVAMLDFIQNHAMVATTYVSLGIEASGLLHAVYLVQHGFATATGKPVTSREAPRSTFQSVWFSCRVAFSLLVLAVALAVTIEALREGKSGMWEGVSPAVSIVVFFLLLCLVGLMEGMQIAAFALLNMTEDDLQHHKIAYQNCTLMFDGDNFQSFLIGRQIFVAALMFVVARIATIKIPDGTSNIFGVPDGVQSFLDTGLLGAVILTVVGSLVWRVVASSYPLVFMSNPLIYLIIRACFLLEATGVCSASWLVALAMKRVFRFQSDDEHLGSRNAEAEEAKAAAVAAAPSSGDRRASFASRRQQSKRASMVGRASSFVVNRRASFASRRFSSLSYSVVRLSSMDIGCLDDDADDDAVVTSRAERLRDSYVASARLSAVVLPEDVGALMQEIGNDYEEDSEEGLTDAQQKWIELGAAGDEAGNRNERFDDEPVQQDYERM